MRLCSTSCRTDPSQNHDCGAWDAGGGVTMPENDGALGTPSATSTRSRVRWVPCAEVIVFGDVTNGASSDLENVQRIARTMVPRWGMSPKIGPASSAKGRTGLPGRENTASSVITARSVPRRSTRKCTR